jgi:hypothetical protein
VEMVEDILLKVQTVFKVVQLVTLALVASMVAQPKMVELVEQVQSKSNTGATNGLRNY